MMENPLKLDGIEFVEFAGPFPGHLSATIEKFGFKKIGRHKQKDVDLYRQGHLSFIINNEPNSFGEQFQKSHGPSICAMAWQVEDSEKAYTIAIKRGAKPFEGQDHRGFKIPAIYGIGNSLVYFTDNKKFYDVDFEFFSQKRDTSGFGFELVDHMTNNVPKGEMQKWCDFYNKIFNFVETRYFDIKGEQTGLISKVMTSPSQKFSIPINEPSDVQSQIQEYIDEYKGSGVQHLALLTNDICKSVEECRKMGVDFLDVPDTYYDDLTKRLPNITEDIQALKKLKILADGDENGYILQIFTKNIVGPIFIEIIQRKNHSGFGQGNFQALFDAIERDQRQRGYIK